MQGKKWVHRSDKKKLERYIGKKVIWRKEEGIVISKIEKERKKN